MEFLIIQLFQKAWNKMSYERLEPVLMWTDMQGSTEMYCSDNKILQ